MKIKENVDLKLKDVDKSGRKIVQAFTRYNVLDSDGDIGRKGMFAETWSKDFDRIKHLLNHDINRPLGKITRVWDDNDYAYYESKIGTHSLGDDFIKMAESGIITEASYGFNVQSNRPTEKGNELLKVKLWEISALTCWGANQYTPVISLEKANQKIGLLEKFYNTSTVTDETAMMLQKQIKGLKSFVSNVGNNDHQLIKSALNEYERTVTKSIESFRTDIINNLNKLGSIKFK